MNEEVKAWHVSQARLIRKDLRTIQRTETIVAWHRWEVGEKLKTYGVYDGSGPKSIPVEDKAEL